MEVYIRQSEYKIYILKIAAAVLLIFITILISNLKDPLNRIKDMSPELAEAINVNKEIEEANEAIEESNCENTDIKMQTYILDETFVEDTISCAESFSLDPYLILAIIHCESRFDPNATNYNGTCIGLMQIDYRYWTDTMVSLGGSSLYNPMDNVKTGCYIMQRNINSYGSERLALNAYNTGDPNCNNGYADRVFEVRERLKRGDI